MPKEVINEVKWKYGNIAREYSKYQQVASLNDDLCYLTIGQKDDKKNKGICE